MIPSSVSIPPALFNVIFSIRSPSKSYTGIFTSLFISASSKMTFCLLTSIVPHWPNCINGLTSRISFPARFKLNKFSMEPITVTSLIWLSARFNHCKFSNEDSGVISSIWLWDIFTLFNCFKFEMNSIFFRPTPSKVSFSKFVMYSKPVISFISFPFSLSISNFLICNKSSFVIGAFTFSLPKFSLLICCCKVLSRITFSFCSLSSFISSNLSTTFWITIPLNLIRFSSGFISNINSYVFSPVVLHLTEPLLTIPSPFFNWIVSSGSPCKL